jgi:drug/metabolite transporter (DMT)-like permease
LYFYILKNLEANRVALIPLVTPVLALIIGQSLNSEIISLDIWIGAAFILIALGMHQWGDQLFLNLKSLLVPIRR